MTIFSDIKFLIFGICIVLIGICIFYIFYLRKNIEIYKENQIKLELSIQEQNKVLELKNSEIAQIKEAYAALNYLNNEQTEQIEKLKNKFHFKPNKKNRDFGEISRAKPGLVNKIINKSTESVNRCFELLTDSKLKEGEKIEDCE